MLFPQRHRWQRPSLFHTSARAGNEQAPKSTDPANKDAEQKKEGKGDPQQEMPPASQLSSKRSNTMELVDLSLRPFQNYPRSLRDLALKARSFSEKNKEGHPKSSNTKILPERPTKEELLQIARGFWTRMRIRFKWFTIRGFRRFNVDDISAFFTLGGLGTAIWIIVGTTTFVSVIFAALSVFNLQGWIAMQLAKFLSAQTGFTIAFGSAIVPKWKEGLISFKDVVITRRAEPMDPETLRKERQERGEDEMGNDLHVFELGLSDEPTIPAFDTGDELVRPIGQPEPPALKRRKDTNFSMFELRVDSIDVQLSLSRWFDGRGILHKMDIRGIRGIVDRRHVFWDPDVPWDPKKARRKAKPNDFDLDQFTIEDFLVTVYQPGNFRPFNLSIFNARIPRLRTQWLFYDLLNADSITGQIDGCLFSLHKPQSVHHTTRSMYSHRGKENAPYFQNWSRLRVDGVNIDHIQKMAGLSGPLMWIYAGRFDMVADIKFPRQYGEGVDLSTVLSEIIENLNMTFSPDRPWSQDDLDVLIPGQPELSGPALSAPIAAVGPVAERVRKQRAEHDEAERYKRRRPRFLPSTAENRADTERENMTLSDPADSSSNSVPPSVVIELDVRMKDIKASMPIFTRALSYSTYTLARPIVAFMNANKTLIPVHCRVVMDLSEFDGSLDLSQTGLPPLVSQKIWEALANHVASQQANNQRVRNVSLWTLDIMSQGLLRVARQLRDILVRSISPEVPPT
ncbi:mdm31-mitochondrial inner membrane protein required for mitochondrial morphology and inheritance [Malassezia pachydermatis]|uniref:Mdm31-mitochondrial inner membrane protein required for mitochondrial morphology and inheritance n=1 Tax=Malassezia pachydermatis TaxID=77020 RepID=A0A0M8MMF5_9BASI|nr:mdm31-mitochondrial inner membrane protein required for mitochondrial morphology and inheritance [Malassezia pachydermatis]KOS15436.1 mdm31-mitochondrial inner membrane protein required for mitochondrial morphology and inheritance [Malassezia pachydermatis]